MEYSTELYERAQAAEAELATLRASMAASKVSQVHAPWEPGQATAIEPDNGELAQHDIQSIPRRGCDP